MRNDAFGKWFKFESDSTIWGRLFFIFEKNKLGLIQADFQRKTSRNLKPSDPDSKKRPKIHYIIRCAELIEMGVGVGTLIFCL